MLNGTLTGERGLCPNCKCDQAADAGGGAAALARCYFESITDVFQRPNSGLYAWLKRRLASRKVRGILLWHYNRCDLWRAEAQSLREAFGLPVLPVEAEAAAGTAARARNGLEAFIEMLK